MALADVFMGSGRCREPDFVGSARLRTMGARSPYIGQGKTPIRAESS